MYMNNKKVHVSSPYTEKSIFGPQGQRLIPTITQALCGTTGISACTVYMPPGRFARPHLHEKSEIIVIVVEGYAASLVGPQLKPVLHGPGEFIFIPDGIVHVAVNLSTKYRLIAFETRTDPQFNEDVIIKPEYDKKTYKIVAKMQKQFNKKTLPIPQHWKIKDGEPFLFADVKESDLM